MRTLAFILFMGINFSSCSQSTKASQSNENFFVFFQGFCMDESFQTSRIKFPLVEISLSEDLNRTETRKIEKKDWKYIKLKDFKTNTFEYYFDNFSKKELPDKDEMVYSVIGIENGTQINYYFKREAGKWYLIKVEDLSA